MKKNTVLKKYLGGIYLVGEVFIKHILCNPEEQLRNLREEIQNRGTKAAMDIHSAPTTEPTRYALKPKEVCLWNRTH